MEYDRNVLYLTRHEVLALDIATTLADAGLTPDSRLSIQTQYAAIIVDQNALTRRVAAVLRRHLEDGRPVVAIADSTLRAKLLGGPDVIWFEKPFATADMVYSLCERLVRSGVPLAKFAKMATSGIDSRHFGSQESQEARVG